METPSKGIGINMIKNQEALRITLLVHSKIAVFEWGKIIIDQFTAQVIKNKYALTTVCDADAITEPDSPVVILGVDSEWLNSALDKLNYKKNKIILVYGITHKLCSLRAPRQAVRTGS